MNAIIRTKQNIYIFTCLFFFLNSTFLFSQNVAITDQAGYSPQSNAMLDVHSPNKGMLVPRVSLIDANNPVSGIKTNGLLVWNTNSSSYSGVGYYFWDGTNWKKIYSGNAVTSVGITAPTEYTVSNSPITSSGDIGLDWKTQPKNRVFASPHNADGKPSFRTLVADDIPNLDASKITSGTLPVSCGGTGLSAVTADSYLVGNGTGPLNLKTASEVKVHLGLDNVTNESKTTMFNNPIFTGDAQAVTQANTDNDQSIATTAFVQNVAASAVTSVGITAPTEYTVSNSPITSSGDIGLDWKTQPKNHVFASPHNADGKPSFRTLVADDIPNLNASKITSGTLPVSCGGTGLSAVTADSYLVGNGTSSLSLKTSSEVKVHLGLDNVTNESKTTMFTNPIFTGDVQIDGNIKTKGAVYRNITRMSMGGNIPDDAFLVIAETPLMTINLPDADAHIGRIIIVKNISTGAINVDSTSGDQIEGAATTTTIPTNESRTFISIGSNDWRIISSY